VRRSRAIRCVCAAPALTIYFPERKLIGGNAAPNRLRMVAMSGNKKQPITMSGNLMRSPRMNPDNLSVANAARPARRLAKSRTTTPGAHFDWS
jgi:hypothetical protein